MKRTLTGMAFFVVMALLSGCSGSATSESAQISRARMVGNENLKLKKQLADKDLQIKDLKKKNSDLEAEKAKIIQDSGDTNIKVMRIVAETEKRNQELTAENQTLKEQLEK